MAREGRSPETGAAKEGSGQGKEMVYTYVSADIDLRHVRRQRKRYFGNRRDGQTGADDEDEVGIVQVFLAEAGEEAGGQLFAEERYVWLFCARHGLVWCHRTGGNDSAWETVRKGKV